MKKTLSLILAALMCAAPVFAEEAVIEEIAADDAGIMLISELEEAVAVDTAVEEVVIDADLNTTDKCAVTNIATTTCDSTVVFRLRWVVGTVSRHATHREYLSLDNSLVSRVVSEVCIYGNVAIVVAVSDTPNGLITNNTRNLKV